MEIPRVPFSWEAVDPEPCNDCGFALHSSTFQRQTLRRHQHPIPGIWVSAIFLVDILYISYHNIHSGSKRIGSGNWNATLGGIISVHFPHELTHSGLPHSGGRMSESNRRGRAAPGRSGSAIVVSLQELTAPSDSPQCWEKLLEAKGRGRGRTRGWSSSVCDGAGGGHLGWEVTSLEP